MKAELQFGATGYLRGVQSAGIGIAGIGAVVLAGWFLDIAALKQIIPNVVSMKANTALAFVLTGLSLSTLANKQAGWRMRRLAQAWAAVAGILGLLTLGEYVLNTNFGIDELLFVEEPGALATSSPGRMSPFSALNFILAALSLLLMDSSALVASVCTLTVGVVGALSLLGYVYGVEALYGNASSSHMAIHTALGFVVFSLARLWARPEQRLMGVITSSSAGGVIARRLVPATVIGPLVLGALHLSGERAGLYGTEFGLTLHTAANVFLLSSLVLWSAASLHGVDMSRLRATQLLVESESRRTAVLIEHQAEAENQRLAALNLAADAEDGRNRAERAEQDLRVLNVHLEQRVKERTAEVERHADLIKAVSDAQSRFISSENSPEIFDSCLNDLLRLTGSAYGFIDEMSYTADGRPYLTARAITNIAWNDETRALYPKFLTGELRFDNLNSLYGAVMTTGAPVIANDAPNDSRRGGIPPGHPPLNAFLGLPMHSGGKLVGVIGLANAPGGYGEHTVAYVAPIVKACANIISADRNEQRKRQNEEELQQLNARLKKGTAALEAANQELEAFAYSVSHDLRAPIRHIAGFGDLLSRKCGKQLDEAGARYLSQIHDSAQKMAELIDDLLEFSRVGRAEVKFRAIALDQLVRAAQEELGPDLDGRDICWNIQALPEVQGDSTLLTRVLVNLLSNAVKYTRHKTPAAIEVGHIGSEDEDVIFVGDNGCGFDMKYANKLFGVFQRLHSTEEFEGTGIGLASVRRIIHLHGGRTWCEGAVDGGATFYFSLPKTQKEAGDGRTEKDSPRGGRSERHRIDSRGSGRTQPCQPASGRP